MLTALFNVGGLLAQAGYDYDLYTDYTVDSAAGLGVFFASAGIWLVCCCIGLIINIALAYLVYSDAKKNNVENGMLWAVVTFFFTLIGLLVYFLAIRPEAMKKGGHKVVEGTETPKK